MKWVALAVMAVLSLSPRLEAASWSIDPATSRVIFIATFEGAEFDGRIDGITGTIEFDPATPQTGRMDVIVDIRSADTGSADLNDGMALTEWFDYARHPMARYLSEDITETAPGQYETHGLLTIKGISRPVTLPFTFGAQTGSALIQGATTLRRTDFNIGEGDWASGEAIGLEVRLEAKITLIGND